MFWLNQSGPEITTGLHINKIYDIDFGVATNMTACIAHASCRNGANVLYTQAKKSRKMDDDDCIGGFSHANAQTQVTLWVADALEPRYRSNYMNHNTCIVYRTTSVIDQRHYRGDTSIFERAIHFVRQVYVTTWQCLQ